MSSSFLIIDGYNLLHAVGLSQARYAPGDLQRQRHRFLVRISNLLTAEERVRCTIVFDAIEAPSGLSRHFRHAEMSVLFAEPGHDADSLIEELIDAHSAPRQLVIVSGDHRLQKAARHRHAESVDSELFLAGLVARAKAAAEAKPPSQSKPSKNAKTASPEDVAFWMDEFGEVDVDAIARSDDPDATARAADPWQKNIDELQKRLDQNDDLDDWLNRSPDRKKT